LFNVLAGVYPPDRGKIRLDGNDITGVKPANICRMGMSRTFQVPKPFIELTVMQNIMVGTTIKNSLRKGYRKALEIIEFVGLKEKMDYLAGDLTIPDLRKLELGRALATEPKVVLLDEVMAGLRPLEVKETLSLIKRINAGGVTLVVIEHIMEAVMTISNRIAVLNYGKKIAEGTPEQIANNADVISAYLGDEYVFPENR
jgi:branched-chain amino acid transport system ATP-binding protein